MFNAVGPAIKSIDEDSSYEKMEGESISFSCIVTGHPLPEVMWQKNDEPLTIVHHTIYESTVTGSSEREEAAINSTLYLPSLTREDSGIYRCVAKNKLDEVQMEEGYSLSVLGSNPGKAL